MSRALPPAVSLVGPPGNLSAAPVHQFFHGTAQRFASILVGGGIRVAAGSGEFGVGFYTQNRVTDAWHWAIARWQRGSESAAVVQISVDPADLKSFTIKGPLSHKKSDQLRTVVERNGKSAYKAGVDVIVGTIIDRPRKIQQKFESDATEALLNSSRVKRVLNARS